VGGLRPIPGLRSSCGIVRRPTWKPRALGRPPAQLEPWLVRAATSTLPPFQRFAKEWREDYAAVKAGVTLPWSQGPIEGQINRLKMLKRQMFGRARLDLLARRFLLAA
jgi:transposase